MGHTIITAIFWVAAHVFFVLKSQEQSCWYRYKSFFLWCTKSNVHASSLGSTEVRIRRFSSLAVTIELQ